MRKGFTLIELLIVITIMAILAGAAVPYVQDYVEDARIAKCREDLGELRNAIMRYEVERGRLFDPAKDGIGDGESEKLANFQQMLVGPFLATTLTDPWGRPYYFSNAASMVFSGAEDGDITTNIISVDCRAAMAPTRAWWYDNNRSGAIDNGDFIDVKFTRPIGDGEIGAFLVASASTPSDWKAVGSELELITTAHSKGNNWMRINVKDKSILTAGDYLCASGTTKFIHDASAATKGDDADNGLYDNIKGENLFDNAMAPATSTAVPVVIKSAQ